jgi:hypothetical protein
MYLLVGKVLKSESIIRTREFPCLIGVLFALVIADGVISQYLIMNNLGIEGNPFLTTWVNQDKFLYIKILGSLLSVFILWDMYKRWSRLAMSASIVFVIVYTCIVYWNIGVFITQRV